MNVSICKGDYALINRTEYINNFKKEKYKRIGLELPKEKYEELKSHIDDTGETVNGFIKRAISETIDRDKSKGSSL